MENCIYVITRNSKVILSTWEHCRTSQGAHATVYWVQESSNFGNNPWYPLLVKMGLDNRAGTRSLRSGGLSSVLKLRAELESMQTQILAQGVGLHWRRPLGH